MKQKFLSKSWSHGSKKTYLVPSPQLNNYNSTVKINIHSYHKSYWNVFQQVLPLWAFLPTWKRLWAGLHRWPLSDFLWLFVFQISYIKVRKVSQKPLPRYLKALQNLVNETFSVGSVQRMDLSRLQCVIKLDKQLFHQFVFASYVSKPLESKRKGISFSAEIMILVTQVWLT